MTQSIVEAVLVKFDKLKVSLSSVIRIHHLDIFHKTRGNFVLLVALEEKPDDHQNQQDSSSGDHAAIA